MTNHPTSNPLPQTDDEGKAQSKGIENNRFPKTWQQLWAILLRLGLGETTLRILSGALALALIIIVVSIMSDYFLTGPQNASPSEFFSPTSQTTVLPYAKSENSEVLQSNFGVTRQAQIHTNLPAKPRNAITTYTVQSGDTIFGIADKFGLKPESILWSNRYVLGGVPENLTLGLEIYIPPEDGTIYIWQGGEGLNGVAKFYSVTSDDIINWPSNKLNKESLGDLAMPNIPAGTILFIPNAVGEITDWLPHITRDTPAESTSFGAGYCGKILEGAVGTGTFIWPTTDTWLSGYDYSSIHHGIDIDGEINYPIYASDSGVVVYAGWSDSGYGNLIILDHGNGWQTVYGHLNSIAVTCAESVSQGNIIGYLGTTGNSTGPHLHFEIRLNGNYQNPWNLLQ